MELVVDTNILFSFFWKNSITKSLLTKKELNLFSPEFALEEIKKYKKEIQTKTKISEKEFKELRLELATAIEFIPIEEYKEFLKEAPNISPDPNDSDFFALALKLKIPIWSNDSLLKKQNKINVLSTPDLLENQKFFEIVFPDK